MFHDLGLLLDPVLLQLPARFQRIVIAAPRMAAQDEVPFAEPLHLPHMGHFVDEMRLMVERGGGEIVAIVIGFWVEMQVAFGGHRYLARVQGEELAPPDAHRGIVDRVAEDAPGEGNLAGR